MNPLDCFYIPVINGFSALLGILNACKRFSTLNSTNINSWGRRNQYFTFYLIEIKAKASWSQFWGYLWEILNQICLNLGGLCPGSCHERNSVNLQHLWLILLTSSGKNLGLQQVFSCSLFPRKCWLHTCAEYKAGGVL